MTSAAQHLRGEDLLTRTTLEIEGSLSAPSIARIIATLQRVPGVLFAEVNATNSSATVAHDSAVPRASLLDAVSQAGAHAAIAGGGQTPAADGRTFVPPKATRFRRLAIFSSALFIALELTNLLLPKALDKPWLLPALVSSCWLAYFVVTAIRNRTER